MRAPVGSDSSRPAIAAFERVPRDFEPILRGIALALVFVARLALAAGPVAERRREMDGWRDCAGRDIGFGTGMDGQRGRMQRPVISHASAPGDLEGLARGGEGVCDF